jgi:hypothetical protein
MGKIVDKWRREEIRVSRSVQGGVRGRVSLGSISRGFEEFRSEIGKSKLDRSSDLLLKNWERNAIATSYPEKSEWIRWLLEK